MRENRPLGVASVLAALLALAGSARLARAGEDLEKLADAVREATFRPEKVTAAKRLAGVGTDEARKKLVALWNEGGDAWTHEAVTIVLLTLEDATVDAALAEHLEDLVPRDEETVETLRARKSPFPAAPLAARLAAATSSWDQEHLVGALGALGTAPARAALAAEVRSHAKGRESLRPKALVALASSGKPEEVRSFALEFLGDADPAVAAGAVTMLVAHGTAADLPRVQEVLAKRTAPADAPVAAVAYRGVAKWGDADVKLATFLSALRDPDERRAQAAIPAFEATTGADVEAELCRLARRGKQQETRLGAADRLASSWPAPAKPGPDRVVPALVAALGEKFEPEKEEEQGVLGSFIKGFANVFTLGAVDALDAWHRHATKAAFEASLKKVADALAKRTGANPGPSPEAWLEWAIDKGYSVGGENVVARLFSGYPERREKARDSAARLLGAASFADLVKKAPELTSVREREQDVELARRLAAKGLPEDEKP